MDKKPVIVIGAGLAGLAAASLLVKKGVPVLVLEASGEPGGRARVTIKDGYTLEYGVHTYRYAHKSSAHRIMEELGGSLEWIKEEHKNWMIKGKDLFAIPGGGEQEDEEKKYFHRPEIGKVRDLLIKLISEAPEKWHRKSLAQYAGALLDDEKAKLLISLAGLQLMEPDPEHLSAGELILHLRRSFDAGVGSAMLKGSSKLLIDKMRNTVIESGSAIKFRTRALAVEFEKGRVKSVDTSEGVIEPEVLVYAAPLQQLFRIAAPGHFPEKLAKKIKHLEPVAGVAIDFGLREKICELPGWLIEPELGIMGKFPSNTDPGLAPEGKQLASWLITVAPEQMSDPETVRSAIHRLRTQVKKLFPDFFAIAEFERILAVPIMDGAALSPKQSILDRPGIAVPGIENLFLAGDCVAAPGARGEIALGSGIEASLKVAQFLGGRLL